MYPGNTPARCRTGLSYSLLTDSADIEHLGNGGLIRFGNAGIPERGGLRVRM